MPVQRRSQSGIAILGVLLILLILVGIGVIVTSLVERNTEQQAAHSRSVVGFYAAEAGLNVAAARVRNVLLGFSVPTDCSPRPFSLGNRNVTYTLSGCGQVPISVVVPAGEPFEGLNALRYLYDVLSVSRNPAGFEEAILQMRFETRLIPMFQLAAFYKEDLELTVGPPMVINGRMHTNADMYLNTESCAPGAQILGQITVVGDLFRGRKDDLTYSNSGIVRIRKPDTSLKVLGRTYPPEDDGTCGALTTRTVSTAEADLWGGRVRLGLRNVSLPGQDDLLCSFWGCPPGMGPGSYWTEADLRIVLDTTTTERLNQGGPPPAGPLLYPVRIYNADGSVDGARTAALKQFMRDVPGGITYADVPAVPTPECLPTDLGTCELLTYSRSNQYGPAFPVSSVNGCGQTRIPRDRITTGNYCYDYRYGGFFSWRERKPILTLNLNWEALEQWNAANGNPLFDPADTTDGGLVVYLTVRGDGTGYAGASPIANNYAVRIRAQTLRQAGGLPGVTFASDQAVYTLGTFNCKSPTVVNDSTPATCGPDGKFPAAMVGDTVNVLSEAWVDIYDPDGGGPAPAVTRALDQRSTQTPRPANRPDAAETFVNAAFLAGNDRTTCPGNPRGQDCGRDYYSGGLENYPRFHENWTGDRLWYRGSLVAIDTPNHTCYTLNAGLTGAEINRGSTSGSAMTITCPTYLYNGKRLQGYWRMQEAYGYVPPPRRWFYEVDFDDASQLPPLSPRFVTLRQEYFTEQFR